MHGLSCPVACGIFPDQGSNPCTLYWHMDSLPLSHQGSLLIYVCMSVKVAQSCPTLCDPMDYTVHGILQARILEWVAYPFSSRSSRPRNRTRSLALQADSLPAKPQGKSKNTGVGSLSLLQIIFLTQEWILYQLSYEGSPRGRSSCKVSIRSDQSLSRVRLFVTP